MTELQPVNLFRSRWKRCWIQRKLERKQSMQCSLKPQNGLRTNAAVDNQYCHIPGLLPELDHHISCILNWHREKILDWCSLQAWCSFHCLQEEDPRCPPRTGVEPSESPGNIKPNRTVWIAKPLSEARWGQPQASTKLVEKQPLPGAAEWAHCLFYPREEPSKARQAGAPKGGSEARRLISKYEVSASPLWHISQQQQNKLFFPAFPCSSSLSSPCKVCPHLLPSPCHRRDSQIP